MCFLRVFVGVFAHFIDLSLKYFYFMQFMPKSMMIALTRMQRYSVLILNKNGDLIKKRRSMR